MLRMLVGKATMSAEHPGAPEPTPELVWVGDGAWVAHDPELPDNDARRVIAYIEHRNHRVDVVWVRERREMCSFETLRDALREVAAVGRRADEGTAGAPGRSIPARIAESVR